MNASEMRISSPETRLIADEPEILDALLPLDGATVLELGCGKAEKTRIVAQRAAAVLALEVDEIQLAKNKAITDLRNVRFEQGGAEKIPAPDSSFDVVLLFKSLHHVPIEQMDNAFSEIHRVLKPGGTAYVSEPVYAGNFNEILRLFHDEQAVREAAFAAEKRAVLSGRLALSAQKFFQQPVRFNSFDQFEEQVINVTHTSHKLSPQKIDEIRSAFNLRMTPGGAEFLMPIRADVFSKNQPGS
jgi:ubiquinone/menaquinone biosynthesis C-methylase UbiE